ARPRRQGACAPELPDAPVASRLAAYLPRTMTQETPLVLVSNRGPATFERGEDGKVSPRRGGGGLVTALTGLVHHREAVWVASAMTDHDVQVSREYGGGSFEMELDGARYRLRLVESDPEEYDRFYNVVANPMLWFI